MPFHLDQMLVQCLIVWSPTLLYQVFPIDSKLEEGSNRHLYLIGLLNGIAAVLCEGFPMSLGAGMIDFRWIPFILSILYGNVRAWAVSSIMLLSYLLYMNHGKVHAPYLVAVLISLTVFPWRKRFLSSNRRKKMLIGAGFVVLYYGLFLSMLSLLQGSKGLNRVYFADGILYVIAITFAILLIENHREARMMRNEVARSEKLNMISEMAASVAHEIRNPLTVARGFIQLAQEDLDDRRKKYMETVIKELDRTDFIISDYLNFAKPQLHREEFIDVEDLMESALNIMQSYAHLHGVTLEAKPVSNLRIQGDGAKLKQVLMNLMKNSIEAMPNGGSIVMHAEDQNHQVQIKITDTGEGMTKEQLQRLGQPFYSTKEKGTGLGLMVTYRLVEAMHGKMQFQSEKNRGTEAILQFPKC